MLILKLILSLSILPFTRGYHSMLVEGKDADQRCVGWNSLQANEDFLVDVTVNSIKFTVPVDTGSTGFLVSAVHLGYKDDTELKKCCKPAFEYLSSSHRYYEGYWLPSVLSFKSVGGTEILSRVPVFAVTEKGKCSSFKDGNCTKTDVQIMPDGVSYMGVGFGRWSKEQPYGTADKNAFLNIDFKGDTTLRQGYVMSKNGIVLGVRLDDFTDGWKVTQLARNVDAPSGRPEWRGTPMCVEVAGSECFTGTALFDTGIGYSFLGVPPNATEHIKFQKNGKWLLQDGVQVKVKIGPPGKHVTRFSFVVGEDDPDHITPSNVTLVSVHSDGAFINTGRSFFNGFDVIFDEDNGTVGLRSNSASDVFKEWFKEEQKPLLAEL